MARKQMVNAFIDMNTYLALKSQDINMSKLIRNALSVAVNANVNEDEQYLLNKIEEVRNKIDHDTKELAELSMRLSILKERNDKEEKKTFQEAVDVVESVKQGGYMNDF